MAELLVFARDKTHPDPNVDKALYKRGDPVVVRPDGHPWGTMEGPPDFVLVKLPGVPVSTLEQYCRTIRTGPEMAITRRREHKVDLDSPQFKATMTAAQLAKVLLIKSV